MRYMPIGLMLSTLFANAQNMETSLFNKHVDAPAVYYAMVHQDSVAFTYSHGHQSIQGLNPIDEHSQFALFSITKTFTAIAILQLQEKGELNIDDLAAEYLPHYPFLQNITIRHLLSHQSGLNNPIPLKWIHLVEEDPTFDYQKFSRETLESLAKNKKKPGVRSAYSNLNFLLLGEIIEQVTGETYQHYITNRLLPGNANIGFQWSPENAVTGYHNSGFSGFVLGLLIDKSKFTLPREGKWIPFKKSYLNGSAYGGLMANPTGLTQFLQQLLSLENGLLSETTKENMFTEQPLNNGKPSGFSLGWHTGTLHQNRYAHHAGGGGGFYLELRVYPELRTASFLLTNKSGFSDQRILDKIDSSFLPHKIN